MAEAVTRNMASSDWLKLAVFCLCHAQSVSKPHDLTVFCFFFLFLFFLQNIQWRIQETAIACPKAQGEGVADISPNHPRQWRLTVFILDPLSPLPPPPRSPLPSLNEKFCLRPCSVIVLIKNSRRYLFFEVLPYVSGR